jgi:hypothetical protein
MPSHHNDAHSSSGLPANTGGKQSSNGAVAMTATSMGAWPGMGRHPQYTRTWLRTMSDKPAGRSAKTCCSCQLSDAQTPLPMFWHPLEACPLYAM